MKNLEFLKTAVFVNKENTKEKILASNEFNNLFIDPYKSFTINTATRLKVNDENLKFNQQSKQTFGFGQGSDLIKDQEAAAESILTYITLNTRDLVLSTAYAFIDALASQFIYEKTKYEDHGEFRFPYKMIEDSDEEDQIDYVCNTVFDIDQLGYLCLKHNSLKETDISIETRVSICFDRLYAILIVLPLPKIIIFCLLQFMGIWSQFRQV